MAFWRRISNDDYKDREKFRLDGRIVLVTGSSAGIGKETARDLALRGATIIMANRNIEKTEQVIAKLCEEEGGPEKLPKERFVVRKLDLSELESVRKFANEIKKEFPVIDILVNNAGQGDLFRKEVDQTVDGFERTFQVNHLSHFLLTYLLIDNVLASPNKPRIINVSSWGHTFYPMDFEDLDCQKNFTGYRVYCVSKLANVLFTKSLARKYEGKLTTYTLHPGTVTTEIFRHSNILKGGVSLIKPFIKTEHDGALTTIYCAVSPQAGEENGLYYENSKVGKPSERAHDVTSQDKLWQMSCEMANIEDWSPNWP